MSTDVDLGKRRFLTASTSAVGAVGAGFVAVPFVKSMSPSEERKLLEPLLRQILVNYRRVR